MNNDLLRHLHQTEQNRSVLREWFDRLDSDQWKHFNVYLKNLPQEGSEGIVARLAFVMWQQLAEDKLHERFPFPDDTVCLFKDGNKLVAVRINFINLQESKAGFGNTSDEAIADLLKAEGQ